MFGKQITGNCTFGEVSTNVEALIQISPPDPNFLARSFYMVRCCLQPWRGLQIPATLCCEIEEIWFGLFDKMWRTIGPQNLERGYFRKNVIGIGGSGWRGWIDLVEAVCLDETPSIYEFMRN